MRNKIFGGVVGSKGETCLISKMVLLVYTCSGSDQMEFIESPKHELARN
jgi:hypothetical protein